MLLTTRSSISIARAHKMSASRTAVSQSFKNSGGTLLDPPTFRIILQLREKIRSYLEEGEAASDPSNHVEW